MVFGTLPLIFFSQNRMQNERKGRERERSHYQYFHGSLHTENQIAFAPLTFFARSRENEKLAISCSVELVSHSLTVGIVFANNSVRPKFYKQ